jgi:hypothetical protein
VHMHDFSVGPTGKQMSKSWSAFTGCLRRVWAGGSPALLSGWPSANFRTEGRLQLLYNSPS